MSHWPEVDEIVSTWQWSSNFQHTQQYFKSHWWTIGQIAEYLRQSWCNKVECNGRTHYFDLLPRRIQYRIVQRIVRRNKWDHALGADDGREVRVYQYVGLAEEPATIADSERLTRQMLKASEEY